MSCPLGPLGIGGSAAAHVLLSGTSVSSLSVSATASSPQADLNPADNTASTSTTVTLPDLTVTASVAADPVDTAGNVVASAVVKNNGLVTATNAERQRADPGRCVGGQCRRRCDVLHARSTVVCPLGSLAAGAQATATVTITSSEQTVVLPFTATETESDLHPADNAASTSAVVGRPDLSTALQASIDPVPFNANVTYTATVTNNGTATATAPHVTFTRPTGTTVQSANAPGGCAVTSGGADCQLGALPVGQSVTATFTVKNTGGGTAVGHR